MNEPLRSLSKSIILAIIFSVLSSVMLLAIIFTENETKIAAFLKIFSPTMFWIMLLGEQFFIWRANGMRKKIQKARYKSVALPGIVAFMQTGAGTVADIFCGVSIILFVITSLCDIGSNTTQYLLIFLIILTFRLHCILNGKNFRYKLYLSRKKDD